MSQEDVELLLRGMEEANRIGISEVNPRLYYHPDVEYVPLRSATEGEYRGIAGIERFNADTEEVFEKFELHFESANLGERVLCWGHIHVRARGSGIETDIEIGGVYEFRDGKVIRWEDFGSKDKALEAVGLSE